MNVDEFDCQCDWESEGVFDPECSDCHGTGTIVFEIPESVGSFNVSNGNGSTILRSVGLELDWSGEMQISNEDLGTFIDRCNELLGTERDLELRERVINAQRQGEQEFHDERDSGPRTIICAMSDGYMGNRISSLLLLLEMAKRFDSYVCWG